MWYEYLLIAVGILLATGYVARRMLRAWLAPPACEDRGCSGCTTPDRARPAGTIHVRPLVQVRPAPTHRN